MTNENCNNKNTKIQVSNKINRLSKFKENPKMKNEKTINMENNN